MARERESKREVGRGRERGREGIERVGGRERWRESRRERGRERGREEERERGREGERGRAVEGRQRENEGGCVEAAISSDEGRN